MSEATQRLESAQRDVAETRAHLVDTAAELRHVVSQHAEAVDPRTYVREMPWIALGLAFGAGIAIAMTGAERKAAEAAADGAKKLGGALADGGGAAMDAVMHRVTGNDEASGADDGSGGVRGKVRGAVGELLTSGLEEILTALGPGARRPQMSVGATGPSSLDSSDNVASDESRAS